MYFLNVRSYNIFWSYAFPSSNSLWITQYQALTSRISDLFWREVRVRDGGWLPGRLPLPDTRGLVHMRTHRDCDSTHNTCTGSNQTKSQHYVPFFDLPYSAVLIATRITPSSVSWESLWLATAESLSSFLTCHPVKHWKSRNNSQCLMHAYFLILTNIHKMNK